MLEFLELEIGGFTLMTLFNAVILAVICLIVIKVILVILDRAFAKTNIDPTVKNLIREGLKVLFLFVAVLVVMDYLEIPVTSLVAVLSVVGLAVSLAVQNFLSNVAGGLQLIASKPFQIGDFVEVGGCTGTVIEIGLFYTKLHTGDNKLVQLPNSSIVAANITNYSSEDMRRVDVSVFASYDSDPELVRQVLVTLAGEHPLTVGSPAPAAHVSAYQESTIAYTLRCWCANGDYWTVYFDLMDQVKPAFEKAGIVMSYPHVNVHMMEK